MNTFLNNIDRIFSRPLSLLVYIIKLIFVFFSVPILMYIFKFGSFAKEYVQLDLRIGKPIQTYENFIKIKDTMENLGEADIPAYSDGTLSCTVDIDRFGPIPANKAEVDLHWLASQLPDVKPGGYYAPKDCRARHRVAILVPYRDRKRNLAIFLRHMHPFLMRQQIEYRIFVIEQYGNGKFNKGALYNIGFLESLRYGPFDCYVFHDVDLLPLDERILYSCPRRPTHMSTSVESQGFELPYLKLFGGVTSLTPMHFDAVNGYSNEYWGWGAEDDDMFIRYVLLRKAKSRFWKEGLRTIQYRFLGRYKRKLYLLLLVDVSPLE